MRTKLFYSVFSYCILMPVIIAAASIAALPTVSAQDGTRTEKVKAEKTKEDESASAKRSRKESEMKGQSRELFGNFFKSSEPNQNYVEMSATYYYGNADKETTPVLLLHDINGRGSEYAPLADKLKSAGYAVLVPDLRGHGQSTKRYEFSMPESGSNARGRQAAGTAAMPQKKLNNEYKVGDFQTEDFGLIFTADMPLLKKTLVELHDKGFINMNRFVIVGAGRSAALAAVWAARDWQNKDSDRFIKTLVLIAPSAFMTGSEITAYSPAAHAASMPRASMIQNSTMSPAVASALADFTKGYRGNRFIPENLAIMTAVPQGDSQSAELAAKLRNTIFNKDEKRADKSKDAEKSKEAEAMFPLYTYPTQKKVQKGEGKDAKEISEDMKFSEILLSKEAHLAETVFSFINKRNDEFLDNNKYYWRKRK